MGLDISHDIWHGAYGAFHRWRNAVWVAAGNELKTVETRWGGEHEIPDLDWDSVQSHELYGHWERQVDDPLMWLMAHHDSDGILYPHQAEEIAMRLEEILPNLPEGEGGGHIGSWKEKTETFIKGLRVAAGEGDMVVFR